MTDLAQLPFYLRRYQLDITIPGANGAGDTVLTIGSDQEGGDALGITSTLAKQQLLAAIMSGSY